MPVVVYFRWALTSVCHYTQAKAKEDKDRYTTEMKNYVPPPTLPNLPPEMAALVANGTITIPGFPRVETGKKVSALANPTLRSESNAWYQESI